MKKILITGAEGFIGSHLVEKLIKDKKNKLFLLVQYNSFSNIGWLKDLSLTNRVKIIYGDIRDEIFIDEITKNIDYVIHLAALISIPYSYKAPKEFINTNLIGSINIFNSCLKNKVKKIIHTSTSEVYGTAQYTPIDEIHPLVGQSPYSASKIASDNFAIAFARSYNLPVIILRPFNCFGPRQSFRAIIPSIIDQCLKYKNIKIGNINTVRDFTFVKDTARAFEKALNPNVKNFGEIINIGSGKSIKISEILKKIIKITRTNPKIIIEKSRLRPDQSEVYKLISSTKKAKKLLNWTAYGTHLSYNQALIETVNWYKNNIEKFSSESKNFNY